MTEEEWLCCINPRTMLNFLRATVSSRKLRLLICARYRREWRQFIDERERRAVEVAEQLADGMVNLQDQLNAHFAASDAMLERAAGSILVSPCVTEATSHHESIDHAISLTISSAEALSSTCALFRTVS